MNKKILSILFVVLICFGTSVSALAVTENTSTETTATVTEDGFSEEYNRVQDYAEVLSADEYYSLNEKYNELIHRQNVDVIICFTNTLEGKTVSDYAETLYEECDYGYGENKDGVMLVISFEDRDWYIATRGYAISVFTDSGIQYIGNQIKDYLSNEDYNGAAERFASLCDEFITDAKNGTPYDEQTGELDNYDSGFEMPPPLWIPISIGIGLIVALIVVLCMRGKLKTVKMQKSANNYLKKDSLNITESRDIFLYSNVTRTEKPKDDDNGSSTHESESGNTYGGGGGKF